MIFRSLFGGAKKVPQAKLPRLHSLVDVSVGGRPPTSVSLDAIGTRSLTTTSSGARIGEKAIFLYTNQFGRFRFSTVVTGCKDGQTHYHLPERVEPLDNNAGAQKRSSIRIDALVPGMWRQAPGGKGFGDYAKGNVRDISRGGCSLIVERLLPKGSLVEVKLQLKGAGEGVEILGEVMRQERIASSGKHSHGLRFQGVTSGQDRAIMDFINRKQTDLRSRGLA